MKKGLLPMNLQFFAEPAGSGGNGSGNRSGNADPENAGQGGSQPSNIGSGSPEVDYAKIQQMLEGTLAAKEDTALKAYFKQQGLSQQEAEQAISAFKAEKAKNQPDVNDVLTQLAQARLQVQQSQVENAAILEAVSMGLDAKTIPYVLKMADFTQATGQDGKINEETLKAAVNKVLEDVPALKPQSVNTTGFMQVGAGTSSGSGQSTTDNQLDQIFGIKKG